MRKRRVLLSSPIGAREDEGIGGSTARGVLEIAWSGLARRITTRLTAEVIRSRDGATENSAEHAG